MWSWIKSWFRRVDFGKIDDVLKESAKICGFLPTIQTVINILAIGNPALITASGIAGAICGAINNRSAQSLMGGGKPTIEGVQIDGSFIK